MKNKLVISMSIASLLVLGLTPSAQANVVSKFIKNICGSILQVLNSGETQQLAGAVVKAPDLPQGMQVIVLQVGDSLRFQVHANNQTASIDLPREARPRGNPSQPFVVKKNDQFEIRGSSSGGREIQILVGFQGAPWQQTVKLIVLGRGQDISGLSFIAPVPGAGFYPPPADRFQANPSGTAVN